jgi:hypothetical protein
MKYLICDQLTENPLIYTGYCESYRMIYILSDVDIEELKPIVKEHLNVYIKYYFHRETFRYSLLILLVGWENLSLADITI